MNAEPIKAIVREVTFESLEPICFAPDVATHYAATARYEVAIGVGEATIGVRFSLASAAAAFAERFGDMTCAEPPQMLIYAVAVEGAAYFWRVPERVRRWGAAASDALLVFFADSVALHEYLSTSADLGLHAAVIARGANVVALVGRSTAGKTTTAIAAVRLGFQLYSDERCIIQNGCVVSFLRAITLREGGRSALVAGAALPDAFDARLRTLPAHGDVVMRPRALAGESAGGPPCPLRAVFIIEGRGELPAVRRTSAYEALPALLRSLVCRETGIDRVSRLIRELHQTAIFRLRLGTPAATIDALERTLQ